VSEFTDIVEARAARRRRLTDEVGDIVALIELAAEAYADGEPDARQIAAAHVAPTASLESAIENATARLTAARRQLEDDDRAAAETDAQEEQIAEQRRRRGMLNQQLGVLRGDLADATASEARIRRRNLIIAGVAAAVVLIVVLIALASRHA